MMYSSHFITFKMKWYQRIRMLFTKCSSPKHSDVSRGSWIDMSQYPTTEDAVWLKRYLYEKAKLPTELVDIIFEYLDVVEFWVHESYHHSLRFPNDAGFLLRSQPLWSTWTRRHDNGSSIKASQYLAPLPRSWKFCQLRDTAQGSISLRGDHPARMIILEICAINEPGTRELREETERSWSAIQNDNDGGNGSLC